MGKSSLVRAVHAAVNATHARRKGGDGQLKLIEIHREDIESLPGPMALMRGAPYRFIVHICRDPRRAASARVARPTNRAQLYSRRRSAARQDPLGTMHRHRRRE